MKTMPEPERTHPDAPPHDEGLSVHTVPSAVEAGTDMHRSKVPADDPRLKLPQLHSRTLRKGPLIAAASLLAGVVLLSLTVALSPTEAPRDAQRASASLAAGGQVTAPVAPAALPDAIRNAPDVPPVAPPPVQRPVLDVSVPVQEPSEGVPASVAGAGAAGALPPPAAYGASGSRALELDQQALSAELFFGGAEVPEERAGTVEASQRAAFTPLPGPQVQAEAAADANLQGRKEAFLAGAGARSTPYAAQPVLRPVSPYEVKAGTVIPLVLLTGINSDLPGQIVGQVSEGVFDTVTGEHLLIPQGSRLLASYDAMVAWGQERVLLCWNRLIRPDGSSLSLECMPGVDAAGYAGASDFVDHHWWKLASGVVLSSLLSAVTQASAGNPIGLQPTLGQRWAAGAASEVANAGQQLTRKNLEQQPTLVVRPGFRMNVLVSRDLVLPPYHDAP